MNSDARPATAMEPPQAHGIAPNALRLDTPRMQYRSRPVSVAVDPVSLVISECISITSAIQKHARSQHSSVSAILGVNPNPVHLGSPSPTLRGQDREPSSSASADGAFEHALGNRWGLRGQRGKSMQDSPMIAGFGRLRHDIAGRKGITRLGHQS
jgi:brefeldin A-resistance guanine nucleotide exchange factor 1